MIQVETLNGPMWVFEDDLGCSRMLREYGEYSELELALMKSFISPEDVVLDVGAHIGAFTIPLAKVVKKVYSVEPQLQVVDILQKNVDLAKLPNVEILPFGLGFNREQRFYTPNRFAEGSVRMEEKGLVKTNIHRLDDLGIEPDFIKIDVEGMELDVLAGGIETIKKSKPYLLVERSSSDLIEGLKLLGYRTWSMDLPIYVPNNWNKNMKDHYPNQGHMMCFAQPNKEN